MRSQKPHVCFVRTFMCAIEGDLFHGTCIHVRFLVITLKVDVNSDLQVTHASLPRKCGLVIQLSSDIGEDAHFAILLKRFRSSAEVELIAGPRSCAELALGALPRGHLCGSAPRGRGDVGTFAAAPPSRTRRPERCSRAAFAIATRSMRRLDARARILCQE